MSPVTPEALLPLLILILAGLVLPARLASSPLGKTIVLLSLAAIFARYLSWRWTETVLPADPFSLQGGFIWLVFIVETLAWIDAAIFMSQITNQSDRRPEADIHERRLRTTPADMLPSVDVLIATYNEPQEVLEKTIVSALDLDWPGARLNVCVLDDGRREWLEGLCARTGARYMTRSDNAHAKAGNINAALKRLDGEFFLVLDADFAPTRPMLRRMMGFFQDPRIGIVQAPHVFFNNDPLQASLHLRRVLPDDQRLFFETIMPGRDGWDAAFCCGSNGIVRRAALREIGDALPTGSITEDMLLTLALKRRGYITRYLSEPLARGLAPESLDAFFVQRARWARGAIQMMFLRDGPFGPGLRLRDRIFFTPLFWMVQPLAQMTALLVPMIYLLTGLMPMAPVALPEILSFQIPALLSVLIALRFFARRSYFPLAATALAVLQSLRLAPNTFATLFKPFGHAFKVTPKGRAAHGLATDWGIVRICALVISATALGLILNSRPEWKIITSEEMIPIVLFWSVFNMIVLSIVATMAVSTPPLRDEERFLLQSLVRVETRDGQTAILRTEDASLTGLKAVADNDEARFILDKLGLGDWAIIDVPGAGRVAGRLVRHQGYSYAFCFSAPEETFRHGMIRLLFAGGAAQPALRTADRVAISKDVTVLFPGGRWGTGTTLDASLQGLAVRVDSPETRSLLEKTGIGGEISIDVDGAGVCAARLIRVRDTMFAFSFQDMPISFRTGLSIMLYGERAHEPPPDADQWRITLQMILRIFDRDMPPAPPAPTELPPPPEWARRVSSSHVEKDLSLSA